MQTVPPRLQGLEADPRTVRPARAGSRYAGVDIAANQREKLDRRGVRFPVKESDGRERTLIRLLPALTMRGEGAALRSGESPPKPKSLDEFDADDPTVLDEG